MPSPAVIRKAANILVHNEVADLDSSGEMFVVVGTSVFQPSGEADRYLDGGFWVGGTMTLGPTELAFSPNAVNRALTGESGETSIPLEEIERVSTEFGVVTDIVVLDSRRGIVRLRCFGARGFAARLRERLPAPRPPIDSSPRDG